MLILLTCLATIFGTPGDKHAGGDTLLYDRPVAASDVGVAHRTIPIGSYVVVTNVKTKQQVLAVVLDRGPYGAIHEAKWLIKKRPEDPGVWRGCLDMTPRAGALIGNYGKARVRYRVVYRPQSNCRRWPEKCENELPTWLRTARWLTTTLNP